MDDVDNLNECKLGNFPEIEVYIIVSCHSHSLYVQKDFCRLVVTPFDVLMSFDKQKISAYNFDLNNPFYLESLQEQRGKASEKGESKLMSGELVKGDEQKIMVADKIQTLDYYRAREYKGLDSSEKKEPSLLQKGKIGIAESYRPL